MTDTTNSKALLSKKGLLPKKMVSTVLLLVLFAGLIAVIALTKTRQDLRQEATGESVEVVFKATEGSQVNWSQAPLTIQTGRSLALAIEKKPSTLVMTAADLTVTFDPTYLEFTQAVQSFGSYSYVLRQEVNQQAGKVRIVVGKDPVSTLLTSDQITLLMFKVKDKLGESTISLDTVSQVAVKGFNTNLLAASSVQPYRFTVLPLSTTTEPMSVQLKLKLAGTPVENNSAFLSEVAKTQPIMVSFQNMETGDTTTPIALSGKFTPNTATPTLSYFTFENAFKSTTLPTGKYNILVKGPKHQQIRYCKKDQTANYRCQITDSIELTASTAHTFDFTQKPLACGDLPISGANKDQQDGAVRVTDYSLMIGCLSKRQDAACVARADCNGDGSVTNLDMDLLLETLSTAYDQ